MHPELTKVDTYIKSLGFSEKTFTDLSKSDNGDSLVSDSSTAYCFDEVSDCFYNTGKGFYSADALLMKNKLYLIEFKHVKSMIADKKEQEILKLKLILKLVESFHTLQNCLFVNSNADDTSFEKDFILVTEHKLEPLPIIVAAYTRVSTPAIGDVYNKAFGHYRQQYKNSNKKVYYDSVDIWADIVFSQKIAKLK